MKSEGCGVVRLMFLRSFSNSETPLRDFDTELKWIALLSGAKSLPNRIEDDWSLSIMHVSGLLKEFLLDRANFEEGP